MFKASNEIVSRAVIGTFGTMVCAGLCLFGAAAPAVAATDDVPRARIVSYGDLNLSNPQGRETLDRRIRRAAEGVCATGMDDLRARTAEHQCVRAAVDGAAARMIASGIAADAG